MAVSTVPVYEFFGAIHGHFFPDGEGKPGALFTAVHQALTEDQHAHLAVTLMDYIAGDIEVQWIGEDEEREGGASFALPTVEQGDPDLMRFAQEHPNVYAEAFQVAVTRLCYREPEAYHAYFSLVTDVFERLHGAGSAPPAGQPS